MVSSAVPPIAVLMTVPGAMPMLFTIPSVLLKVPGFRLTVDGVSKPDRSSVLALPPAHKVMTGFVLRVKSKNLPQPPTISQLNPNVTLPVARTLSVCTP